LFFRAGLRNVSGPRPPCFARAGAVTAMSSSALATSPTERLRTYASFVRFEHTLFSLPLLVAGVFSAPGAALPASRWALIALAAVGARTAALAINRLVDRRIDALNPRTRSRELPAGRMTMLEAYGLLVLSLVVYVAACAALGPWYLAAAIVPLAVFVIYPLLKRFTPFCHFGVGVAIALAPLAGYAAAHPGLASPGVAVWIAGFALLWVAGFDIIYATLDEEFDRAHGVHSMVAWLGRARALRLSWALHLGAIAALAAALLDLLPGAGAIGWTLAAVGAFATAVVLLVLEQRWAEDVNLAFFKTNVWVGFAVLAMVLCARAAGGL
jgi:4-hydroxybenzoate polyprenyltransferase